MKLNSAIFALLVLSSSTAAAQPGGAAPMPPPPPPTAESSIDLGVMEDANSGRGWLTPTALTNPAGTFSFHDWMLFLAGVGYSPTDTISLSATTLVPITTDMPLLILLSGKAQVIKSGRLRVAAHGTLNHIREGGDTGDFSFTSATLGGAATLCLDDECHSLVNGFAAVGFALEDVDQSAFPLMGGGALVQRLTRHVKLVLEVTSAAVFGETNEVADGALGYAGVRFTSRKIGVDLGMVRPFPCDCGSLIAVPWLTFNYRGL